MTSMEKNIVHITGTAVQMESGLTDSAFSKTNMGTLIEESGWHVTITGGTTVFTPWYFEKTERTADGQIIFIGPAFSGTTLYEIFQSEDYARQVKAGYAACAAITAALTGDKALAACGAGGILYGNEGDSEHLLFLPGNLFDRAARNQNEPVQSKLQGHYLRLGLNGSRALQFNRAVIAYQMLCHTVPFSETDPERRQSDILDAAYTPVQFLINGISADLSRAIHEGLITDPDSRKPENGAEFPLELLKNESGIQNDGIVTTVRHTSAESEEIFSRRRTSYLRRRHLFITLHRFVRRNTKQLIAAIAVCCVAFSIVTSFNKENERLATSTGLTSTETVETLYTGIHRADVTIVQEIAKGSKMKNLIQIVSGFYVTIRTRQSMEETGGTVTPAEWIFFRNTSNFWMYGITNYQVDGKPASADFPFPTRGNHGVAIQTEDGVPLKHGMTKTHTATYYLVHNDSDSWIQVNKMTDTVTLTWQKNKWVVTNITGSSDNTSVNAKTFRADYQNELSACAGNIDNSVGNLRNKYPWLPGTEELKTGAAKMITRFNSTAAKEYLSLHL